MRKNAPEVLFVSGLLSLAGGIGLIYPPAALIAVGVVLLTLGIVGAMRWDS